MFCGNNRRREETPILRSAAAFASYVQKAREKAESEQEWNTAIINIAGMLNCTGKIRDINKVLESVLRESGGTSAIEPIRYSLSTRARIVRTLKDGEAANYLERTNRAKMKRVYFSL